MKRNKQIGDTMLAVLILASLVLTTCATQWYNPGEELNCISSDDCSCTVNGRWDLLDAYVKLQQTERDVEEIEQWIRHQDVTSLMQQTTAFSQKFDRFERDLDNIAVDEALMAYSALQREAETLASTAQTVLRNGSIETELLAYENRVSALSQTLEVLWQQNTLAVEEKLNIRISEMTARLASCQEIKNGSYFRGDTQPVNPQADKWCELYEPIRIGDALTHALGPTEKGNWFKDPYPVSNANITGIWLRGYSSYGTYGTFIYAENYTTFIDQTFKKHWPTTVHNTRTYGLGYLMYNGSIYYHYGSELMKYTVSNDAMHKVSLNPSSTEYLQHSTTTWVDMKVDEYGLYAIYTDASNEEKLIISKYNPLTLQIENSWNTNRHKSTVCATFMVCGKLYTLDNCWSRLASDTNKQYVMDTITGKESYEHWHLSSKYGHIWIVGYNPRERVIFAWDSGHLVTYPLIWRSKSEK